MKAWKWKCGLSLRNIVKFIAVLETVVCVVAIIPTTLIMVDVCFNGHFGAFIEFVFGIPKKIQLLGWLALWATIVMKLILDVNLYRGANNKNYEKLVVWLNVTGGVVITCYFWSVLSLNMFWTKRGVLSVIAVDLAIALYKGFEMIAVYKLAQKLKRKSKMQLFRTSRVTAPISITDFQFGQSQSQMHLHGSMQNNEQENEYEPNQLQNICIMCRMKLPK